MISIDTREKSRVPQLLSNLGVPTERKTLEVGDYVISGPTISCCISLKQVGDYLSSINSQHLSDELYQMSSCYNRSVLIIFGNLDEALLMRKIRRETYFQYLAGVVTHISDAGLQGTISALNFTTDFDVSKFLQSLHNLISTDDIYREPSVKKIKVTEETRTILNISRLPGVGSTRANSLLKHFKSIRNIYNATPAQLEEVEGVGKGIAKLIYEFVNKEHKEE
jgi:ERCC4-type nuclease